MSKPDFGVLLRRFRLAAGLSQEALAERAGLSRNAVSALERGTRTQPYAHTVLSLATALGLSDPDHVQFMTAARPPNGAIAERSPVPAAPTSIIGREAEIVAIERLLTGTQLLTLTGPGGVGKTRLALEMARFLASHYADGVVFVPLAPLSDAALVVAAIGARLDVRDTGDNLLFAIQQQVRHKHLLLVLDNFEHVLPAAADVAELLSMCPTLRMITTSRAPLRVRGESEFPVRPLPVPQPTQPLTVSQTEALPATMIFLRQARAVNPHFVLAPEQVATVLAICQRLDGIPLALELAAAWIRVLAPHELLARLDHALPLLMDGARDLPERQQTMRNTIAWSYQLLSSSEQLFFCRLSAFAGGWTLAMAEALVGQVEALPLLGQLVEHSLVVVEPLHDSRYRMLEPIRQYGLEQLEVLGVAREVQDDHAACMLRLADAVGPELHGPQPAHAIERLSQEQDNIRVALSWWLRQNDVERVARLAGAVWRWWELRGQLSEGRRWLGQIHPRAALLPANVRAELLFGLGTLAHAQGDYAPAVAFYEESLVLARAESNDTQVIQLLSELGVIAHKCADYGRAVALLTEALALSRAPEHSGSTGWLLNNLGWAALWHGDSAYAVRMLEEGLVHVRQAHNVPGMMATLNSLAIALMRRTEYARAEGLFHESLALAGEIGHQRNLAYNLGGLAELALARGDIVRTARLLGADEALRERMAYVRPPIERSAYARVVSEARTAIGASAFQAAWIEGQMMTLEQAIAYALDPIAG